MDGEGAAPQTVMQEAGPQAATFQLLVVVHTHWITGRVVGHGAPRRLTDFLNNCEGNLLVLRDGRVEHVLNGEAHRFEVAQVPLETVLFAAPRGGLPHAGDPFERVTKTPVPVTLLIPGFQISGSVFTLPGTPLSQAPIGARRFTPVADAVITPDGNGQRAWTEPIIALNTARAVICSPLGQGGA